MKGDQVYLQHILDAIEKIETYVAVGHDKFISESHWQDAVIRQLEIIGEATKRLSEDLCKSIIISHGVESGDCVMCWFMIIWVLILTQFGKLPNETYLN